MQQDVESENWVKKRYQEQIEITTNQLKQIPPVDNARSSLTSSHATGIAICENGRNKAGILCGLRFQASHPKPHIPSDGVDRDIGGESGQLLKMSLLALGSF